MNETPVQPVKRKAVFGIISLITSVLSLFPVILNAFMALLGAGIGMLFGGKSGASFSEMFLMIGTAEGAGTMYVAEIVLAAIAIIFFAVGMIRREKALVLRIIAAAIAVISIFFGVLLLIFCNMPS